MKIGEAVYSREAAVRNRRKFEILSVTVIKYPLTPQCGTLNYSGSTIFVESLMYGKTVQYAFLTQITLTMRLKQCTPNVAGRPYRSGLP